MALQNTSTSFSFSTSSAFNDEIVANISASSYVSNQIDITINILDITKYIANKEGLENDISEFCDIVVGKITE